MEASKIVIKVKYGDVLRRFSSWISDDELDVNMDGLMEKILSLFNLPQNSSLMLTYIDEDGDEVALVDDADLHDVVKQSLNPLRITVKLTAEKNGRKYHASGSSTPLKSPWVQKPFQSRKTAPEPLCETLVKLSTNFASKVSSSGPDIAELINYFSEVSSSYLAYISESGPRMQTPTHCDVPESATAATEMKDSKTSTDAAESTVPSNVGSEELMKQNESLEKLELERLATVSNNAVKHGDISVVGTEDLSATAPGFNVAGHNSQTTSTSQPVSDSLQNSCPTAKSSIVPSTTGQPVGDSLQTTNKEKAVSPKPDLDHISPSSLPSPSSKENVSASPTHPACSAVIFSGSSSQNDGLSKICHEDVVCDGCGAEPIFGPRFTSKVKVNYDLCITCFSGKENESDYIRMDLPEDDQDQALTDSFQSDEGQDQASHQDCTVFEVKSCPPNLDSYLIQDVNIFDDTVMTPLTSFTKIWRMRNTGVVAWPQKTQLLWTGGDKLGDLLSVELKIPATGLAVGQDFDVAVDFITPESPGRYMSHWRMASPSGEAFGQHIWVHIQVKKHVKRRRRKRFNMYFHPGNSDLTEWNSVPYPR